MTIVRNHNGTNDTAEGMTHYRFSGTPTDQYEHRFEIGEQRVMKVVVMCVGSGEDQISDGVRHLTKLRVVNAEIGELHKPATDHPEFDFNEDGDGDSAAAGTDYGDYPADSDTTETEPSNVVTAEFSDNA